MRLIIAGIAVVAGGAAAWVAYQAAQSGDGAAATVVIEAPQVDVLATRVDLLRGATLTEGAMVWTRWPESGVRDGMVLRSARPDAAEDFAGRLLRSNVYEGEPLREQHISAGAGGYLSLALRPQMLAVGVAISEDRSAGGFILPNDQVDVLHTVVRDIDGDGDATGATRTILTNIRVLAIGQTTFDAPAPPVEEEGGEKRSAGEPPPTIVGRTATLEVTSEQAEALLAAAASGQITLALRASEDFGLSGVGDLTMIEGPKRAPDPPAATAPDEAVEPPPKRAVRIISTGVARVVVSDEGEGASE